MTFSITTKDTWGLYIFVLEVLAWIFISRFYSCKCASRIISTFKMLNLTRGGQQLIWTRLCSDSKDKQMLRARSTLQLPGRSSVQIISLWTLRACDKVLYRIMQSTVYMLAQSLHWLRANRQHNILIFPKREQAL